MNFIEYLSKTDFIDSQQQFHYLKHYVVKSQDEQRVIMNKKNQNINIDLSLYMQHL